MTHRKHHTDTIIIGGGLAGLICAAYLEKAGLNYYIFEALDEWGGLARGQNYEGIWLDYGLKSIPVGDISSNPLVKIKQDLALNYKIETVFETPVTFAKNGFVEFVGFGEFKNKKIINELTYYTEHPRLLVSNGWKTLVDELTAMIPENRRFTKSHLTKLEMADEKITTAVINGEDRFTADQFIFTLSPTHLLSLLPQGAFSPKATQKLSKVEGLTSLSLDVATAQRLSPLKSNMILAEQDFLMIGQFVTNRDPLKQSEGLQISNWLTLMDSDEAKDDEAISKTLKTMKKLIKKAFPELLDKAQWERIILAPESHGGVLDVAQQLVNLYLVGGQYSHQSRYLPAAMTGAIDTAQALISKTAGIPEKTMFEDLGI